jgi:hypothetical protein
MNSAFATDYLPEAKLAEELDSHPRTVKRWRELGDGPPHVRIGNSVFYRRAAVEQWLLDQEQNPRSAT